MRSFLVTTAAAVAVALAGYLMPVQPAQAQVWPWCADLNGDEGGGATNCGFASWQQCQTYISGIGGWCYRNPYAQSEPAPRRERRPR
jgi:hypothetical protein